MQTREFISLTLPSYSIKPNKLKLFLELSPPIPSSPLKSFPSLPIHRTKQSVSRRAEKKISTTYRRFYNHGGRRGRKKSYLKRPKGKKNNNPTAGSSSSAPPPWIELPRDVTENILRRLGVVEILENAQKVCTTWRSVCREPSLWRVTDMKKSDDVPEVPYDADIMCRRAVDRSQGELIDINIEYFGTDDLLCYISDRSSHHKRLRLARCGCIWGDGLTEAVKKFPELEELHLFFMPSIRAGDIETIMH